MRCRTSARRPPGPTTPGWSSRTTDGACAECALLAGGTSAVAGDAVAFAFAAPVGERAVSGFRSRPADAPSYFSSRAPPVLL